MSKVYGFSSLSSFAIETVAVRVPGALAPAKIVNVVEPLRGNG